HYKGLQQRLSTDGADPSLAARHFFDLAYIVEDRIVGGSSRVASAAIEKAK
ncbi:hypothetical protein LTR95_016406, partial [Oleoguttula sp. CCFEE 5521]